MVAGLNSFVDAYGNFVGSASKEFNEGALFGYDLPISSEGVSQALRAAGSATPGFDFKNIYQGITGTAPETMTFGHSTATEAGKAAMVKEGAQEYRGGKKLAATTDDWSRYIAKTLGGDFSEGFWPKAKGMFGAISDKSEEAIATAKKFGTSNPFLRGIMTQANAVSPIVADIPTNLIQQSKGMLGTKQGRVASDVFNYFAKIGDYKNIDPSKFQAMKPSYLKQFTKTIPIAGQAISAADAALRFKKGDYLGAGLSAASMIPVVGLPAIGIQIATDIISNRRKKFNEDWSGARSGVITNRMKKIKKVTPSSASVPGGGSGGSGPRSTPKSSVSHGPPTPSGGSQGRGGSGGGGQGGGQAAGQRPSRTSRPSGYAAVRKYGRARGGIVSLL